MLPLEVFRRKRMAAQQVSFMKEVKSNEGSRAGVLGEDNADDKRVQ